MWFCGLAATCLVLVAATVVTFWPLNLRDENNLAALFSSMLLLLLGLHAYDGAAANRGSAPRAARAWSVLTLVLVLLSADELASLHERLPADTHGQYWLWVLPFALAFIAMGAHALIRLFQEPRYRKASLMVFAGFLLFLLVAGQEELEWRLTWSEGVKPIRAAVEDGTELLGMMLILAACMANTRGRLSRDALTPFPVLEAVRAWRWPVLGLGLVAAPLIAVWTVSLGRDEWNHGLPALWPPAVIFFLAMLAAVRPVLSGAGGVGWTGWALAAVAAFGCATTTLDVAADEAYYPLVGVCVAASVLFAVDPRFAPRLYVPAIALFAGRIAGTWVMRSSDTAHYCLSAYAAIGCYDVLSGPQRPPAGAV